MNIKDTHLVARAEFQVDVLSYGRRRAIGAGFAPLLQTELGPCLPLRYAVVYDRLLEYALRLPRDLSWKECSVSLTAISSQDMQDAP